VTIAERRGALQRHNDVPLGGEMQPAEHRTPDIVLDKSMEQLGDHTAFDTRKIPHLYERRSEDPALPYSRRGWREEKTPAIHKCINEKA